MWLARVRPAAEARFVRRHAVTSMSWHASPAVCSLGIALSVAAATSDCAQPTIRLPPPITVTLPPSWSSTAPSPPRPPPESAPFLASRADSVAVCAGALLATERVALGREPTGALLLQQLAPRDTALEQELLRRHAIAGVCSVAGPFTNVCTNGLRGLTASFELGRPIISHGWAFAIVRVRPMRAAGDYTWLFEPWGRSWGVELIRRDSAWVAAISSSPRIR